MRLVLVLVAGVLLSRFISVDLAIDTAWRGLVNVVLANLVVLGVVLVVFAARAPARIHAAQEAKIGELAARKRDSHLAESLARHDEIAVHQFWAKHPKREEPEATSKWFAELEAWTQQLFRIMEEGGCDYVEIKSVRVLGNLQPYFPEPGTVFHKDRDVNKALIQLSARRSKLAEIIQRYTQE